MTHDELIAYIDDSTNGLKHEDIFSLLLANTKALRAVVELHKPLDNLIAEFCSHCTEMSGEDIYTLYPCLTIKAIEKGLA
jgi:hypothetical protein